MTEDVMQRTSPLDYRVVSTDPADVVDECHADADCPHHHRRDKKKQKR